jgi:hypothetical protein
MLLTMKSDPNPPPPESFSASDILAYGTRRWRRVQALCDDFFKRWRQEYIHNLIAREKWRQERRNVEIGDIVLMKNEAIKRNYWPVCKVQNTHKSNDGYIRSATVKFSSGQSARTLVRPITDLVMLIPHDSEEARAPSSGECRGLNAHEFAVNSCE